MDIREKGKADVIFFGGNIITMDDSKNAPVAEAVAIAGKTILDVGSMEDVIRRKTGYTKLIFLNQQTLMPGFIEPHQHAIQNALLRTQYVSISGDKHRTYKEIRDVMEATIANNSGSGWAIFMGWDPELVNDLPMLNAEFLDSFSIDIPVVVVGQSGHVAWVNTLALAEAGIEFDTPNPPGGVIGRDKDGNATGQLFEEPAIMMVIGKAPVPDVDSIAEAMSEQWRVYASAGLTTVTDLIYMPDPTMDKILKAEAEAKDFPVRLGLYRLAHAVKDEEEEADRPEPYPAAARCCPQLVRTPSAKGKRMDARSVGDGIGDFSDRLWEVGHKLYADGSPHVGTAALREPFLNTPLTELLGFPPAPSYGMLNMDTEALHDTVRRFHLKGKQVSVHCNGERAAEQVLRVYEQVEQEIKSKDNRHRMEHCLLMTPEQIARAGKCNVALSFMVDQLRFYAKTFKNHILGDRVNRIYALSEASKSDVTWTIHQDQPAFPGDPTPLGSMKSAVTRCHRDDDNTPYGPEYSVSIHEALKAYTVNAAWQLHVEDKIGSIKVGKKADFVVLSENPYHVTPFELEKIRIIETFVDGNRNNLAQLKTFPKNLFYYLERTDA